MKKFDLLMCILDFTKPTKKGQFMNQRSYDRNVLEDEETQFQLNNGGLLGLFTHKGRYNDHLDENISYKDNIAKNEDFCNTTVYLEKRGTEVLAGMNLTNQGSKGYNTVVSLFNNNIPVGVSMSTLCKPLLGNEYEITKLLGVDFTLDPAFTGTGLRQKNFSNNDLDYVNFNSYDWDENHKIYNFSGRIIENNVGKISSWNIPFDIKGKELIKDISNQELFSISNEFFKTTFDLSKLSYKNFSMKSKDLVSLASSKPQHFSLLKQLMKEASFPPHRQLQRRIEELVSEVRGKNSDYIERNKQVYLDYINTPIYNWISRAFNNDSKIMLTVGLRLNRFVKNPGIIQAADRKLEYIKKKRNSMGGIFDKNSQKEINNVLKNIFEHIWKYIEERSNTSFMTNETIGLTMKSFSETLKFKSINDWLDAGSDGQKDYKLWIDSFPYSAPDLEDYKKSKEFYGDEKLDKLIYNVLEKNISQKEKELLINIMKETSVNFDNSTIKDSEPISLDEEKESLSSRTLTDNDIDMLADKLTKDDGELITKLMEKLEEKGVFNNNDSSINDQNNEDLNNEENIDNSEIQENNENDQTENQIDNEEDQNNSENSLEENNENVEAQPPQDNVSSEVVNDSKFPKPKVISKQEAAKLTNMNFSDIIYYHELINKLPIAAKRKMISFSVIDSFILESANQKDIEAVYFSLGKENSLSQKTFEDLIILNQTFSEGLISLEETNNLKQQLLIQEIYN